MKINTLIEQDEPEFKVGDEVVAKSRLLSHFIMTIYKVNSNGTYSCRFGFSGRHAGDFFARELNPVQN